MVCQEEGAKMAEEVSWIKFSNRFRAFGAAFNFTSCKKLSIAFIFVNLILRRNVL